MLCPVQNIALTSIISPALPGEAPWVASSASPVLPPQVSKYDSLDREESDALGTPLHPAPRRALPALSVKAPGEVTTTTINYNWMVDDLLQAVSRWLLSQGMEIFGKA